MQLHRRGTLPRAAAAGIAKNVGVLFPAMMTKIFGSITSSMAAEPVTGGSFWLPGEEWPVKKRLRKEHARMMRATAMRSMVRNRPPKR